MKSFSAWLHNRTLILSVVLLIFLCMATLVGMQMIDFSASDSVTIRSQEGQVYRPSTDCPAGGCDQQGRQTPIPGATKPLPPFLQALQQNKSGSGDEIRPNQGGIAKDFVPVEDHRGIASPMFPGKENKKSEEIKAAVYDGFSAQSRTSPQYRFRPFIDEDSPKTEAQPSKLDLLTAARTQYWNGDLDAAVKAYSGLIRYYPDEPDFSGELGNIYYQQGKQDLAAEAYYKAALLLLQRREYERAGRLLDVLNTLNKKLADELERQLKKS